MGELEEAGVVETAAAVREGAVRAIEITSHLLARIEQLDPALRAFVAVDAGRALQRAEALDAERASGHLRGPLHGVPVAYKDVCFVRGLPAACGTDHPDYFSAAADCAVARRLTDAGAITLGKLAMSQLAMGTLGLGERRPAPCNPWAPDRIPGGSSSGCGVALAARLVAGAIGTDTGGSIRIPAACCGVVGLKPTLGSVSRAGVMPLSRSLDHVGPMARRTRDVALLFCVMAGARAPASAYRRLLDGQAPPVETVRVGVADDDYFRDVSDEVAATMAQTREVLQGLGVDVRRLALPDSGPMMAATGTIVRVEAAAEHAGLLGEPPDALEPLVRARLEAGLGLSAVDYVRALRARAALRVRFIREVFGMVDVLLVPALPARPLVVGEATGPVDRVAARMATFAKYARLFNGLGVPALALPAGFTGDGVPLAVQLVARPFAEAALLGLGAAYEDATRWFRRRPPGAAC